MADRPQDATDRACDMQPFEAHAALTDAIANIYHGGFTLGRWAKLLEQINSAILAAERRGEERMRERAAKEARDRGADLQAESCGIGICCGHTLVAIAAAIGALPLTGDET